MSKEWTEEQLLTRAGQYQSMAQSTKNADVSLVHGQTADALRLAAQLVKRRDNMLRAVDSLAKNIGEAHRGCDEVGEHLCDACRAVRLIKGEKD